jgi:unsaturated chondroitin disaccharide hydrolase
MRYSLFLIIILATASCAHRNNSGYSPDRELLQQADRIFAESAAQYKVMMKNLPRDKFPRNYSPVNSRFETSGSDWWCSGFYPGTLLYLYEETGDTALYAEALRIMKVLEKEKHNKGTHDLGFMMFCSFGHANRIAPRPEYNEILLTSARSLSSRFDPKVASIRSWNSGPSEYLVIIDNMMNLELLFWASRHSGDTSFRNIALTHANTTIQNHYRSDYSSWHVINYDQQSGKVRQKRTAQGYSDESAWARGQSWGLYGFVAMYRETKDKKYLEQARKIAAFLLNHPNLPADKVPYWDFNAPDIPNALRDASAAAIMASALLELCTYVDKKEGENYFNTASTILKTLSGPAYRAAAGTNGGFLLKHSVGHLPQRSEVDVALTYADYYFIEALARYKKMNGRSR